MLAGGPAAEVPAGHQDAGAGVGRLVEHETGLPAPVREEPVVKARALDPLAELGRDDLVGVDVGPVQRDGPAAHYNLMKRVALAMGATEDEVAGSVPAPPVQRFVDYLLTVCRTEPPPYAMLAIYVNESQTPESVKLLADALRKQFGLSDDDLAWFTVHASDDVEHADTARELIRRYGGELADFERYGMFVIERGCREWTELQDFYYSLVS